MEETKLLFALVIITVVLGTQSLAEEGNALSQKVLTDVIQQAVKLQSQADKLINENQISNILQKQHPKKSCLSQGLKEKTDQAKGCIANIRPTLPQRVSAQGVSTQGVSTPKENADRILVFVSFSMPEASLKALAQDAEKHSAVLVMRGLYQDSFAKTAQKLQELGVFVDINPELFETHHITSVPTFVLIRNDHPDTGQVSLAHVSSARGSYSLKGNVTLAFASKNFKDQCMEDENIEEEDVGDQRIKRAS